MRILYSLILVTVLFASGCNSEHSTSESKPTDASASSYTPYSKTEGPDSYTASPDYDGTYCAKIKYYNPSTGTTSYYELTVDVTGGYLTKIYFPNGGWLDNTHFTAPLVTSSGHSAFTSDKGYQYEVIIQSQGECSTSSYLPPPPSYNGSNSDNTDGFSEDDSEEQQVDGKAGEVVKTYSGCDYFIISMNGDYVVAEWMGQYTPDEGDRIRGKLNSFGTKEFWVVNKSRTTKLWIDDYGLNWEDAVKKIREECNLE
jgi:hypothetical protein